MTVEPTTRSGVSSIPDGITFAAMFRKAAHMYASNPAVVCGERTATYGELFARACRLVSALQQLGAQPGDRVAVLADNCFEVPEIIAGLALGGYVRTGLYAHNSPESNRYLLDLTEARVLIGQQHHLQQLRPALQGMSLPAVVVGTGEYEQMLAAASDEDRRVPVTSEDLHHIRFSAGTTGKPKAIAHTTRGWIGMGTEFSLGLPRLHESDRYLAAGPLTHAAMMPFWPVILAGGCVVVMPAFDPGAALELIERERCTLTFVVPTMIQMMVTHPDATTRDLSSLRCVIYGAAPISERTVTEALGVWGNIMYQVYGQSEAIPATMMGPEYHRPDGSERERRWLRSLGRPLPNVEVTIVDDDLNELPIGEVGELAVLTPGRMKEMWGDPEATRSRLLPDGRVLTRDLGYVDEDGFVYITDRKEDLIISGGFNIWPAELENALMAHPAVLQAAVVGIPHERWGETPVATVVLRDGQHATEEELIAVTRDRLGAVKKVTAVRFADTLPTSAVGKILRREVRKQWTGDGDPLVSGA